MICTVCQTRFEMKEELTFKEITLNLKTKKVFKGSKQIQLTPTELALLQFFMMRPNWIHTRFDVIDQVWGSDYLKADSRNLAVYLGYLRKKLGKDVIKTVYGYGLIMGDL